MSESSEILVLFKEDERKGMRVLYDTYYDSLLHYANQILDDPEAAADIVQERFIDFWANKRYESVDTDLSRYLSISIKRSIINHVRGNKRRLLRHEVYTSEAKSEEVDEDSYNLDELLYSAIEKLPEERKKLFKMIYFEGMKYQEAADRLGVTINTVKKQMGRAFQMLREELRGRYYPVLWYLMTEKKI